MLYFYLPIPVIRVKQWLHDLSFGKAFIISMIAKYSFVMFAKTTKQDWIFFYTGVVGNEVNNMPIFSNKN
jgi:hypothetical protein